jgi:hypothetical protein
MKSETRNILLQVYVKLQEIIDELYEAHDRAIANNDFDDANLLASRADKLYEEAENLEIVISEQEQT